MAKEDKELGLKHPLQQENKFGVGARKWKNWPDICQRVFNETYYVMYHNQSMFMHPKGKENPDLHWKTTAWNAAWVAADACQQALKDIIAVKGYMRKPIP